MLRLKSDYIKLVASDQELQGKIAKKTNRSAQSVKLWGVKSNHERLLMKPVLTAIAEFVGLNEESITEDATTPKPS